MRSPFRRLSALCCSVWRRICLALLPSPGSALPNPNLRGGFPRSFIHLFFILAHLLTRASHHRHHHHSLSSRPIPNLSGIHSHIKSHRSVSLTHNLPLSPSLPDALRRDKHIPMSDAGRSKTRGWSSPDLFELWKASRPQTEPPDACCERMPVHNPAGFQRKCSIDNMWLAYKIIQVTLHDMLTLFWSIDPLRTALLVLLTLVRGFLPAFRGYSQALIIDEVSITFFR